MVIRAAGHYYQRVHDLSSRGGRRLRTQTRARLLRLPYHVRQPRRRRGGRGRSRERRGRGAARRRRPHRRNRDRPGHPVAGRANHPERPYTNARVRPIANDARSYLRTTDRTYDLIVYGLLDSHTLLSHASSVRLDSFVYTVEGFKESRARLKPGGCWSFRSRQSPTPSAARCTRCSGKRSTGRPAVVSAGYDGAVVFLQTKEGAFAVPAEDLAATGLQDQSARYRESTARVDVSTDDWPFFYMPRRVYPVSYLLMLGMVLLGSLFLTRTLVAERPSFGELPFAFLGAGFMLVETKAITELGLTFGNTWQVIGIVIAGVLTMAFLANLVCIGSSCDGRTPRSCCCSAASPSAGSSRARAALRPPSPAALPLPRCSRHRCFSRDVFSTLLGTGASVAAVMAANLLGAMAGGLLEYNSMYFGFRFLYLLAMALYLIAWAQTVVGRRLLPSVTT